MLKRNLSLVAATALSGLFASGAMSAANAQLKPPPGIDNIQTVVIIYAENRSFDNLYGSFPGRTVCATREPPPSSIATASR